MDKPMPFQVIGAKWLASMRRAILADVMGLGKTIQAIQACDLVRARRVAVICPAIGRINWQREVAKWSLWGFELYVESYDRIAVSKKARDELRAFRPDTLICDEAHYLKSKDAKRTQRVYGRYIRNDGLAMIPRRVWLLTGTLTPNNVTELWTHLRALFPELLPTDEVGDPFNHMAFTQRYAKWQPAPNGAIKITGNNPAHLNEVRAMLKKIVLRRTVEQAGIELPPIHWMPTYVIDAGPIGRELAKLESSPEVDALRRVYEAAAADETQELYIDEDPIVMATVARLTAELKAKAVGRLIADELGDGAYDKIVVFGRHLSALDLMAKELAAFDPVHIRGGQSDKDRQRNIDAFQRKPEHRVILVQLDAGYHTITLHAATQVAFLELAWTPDVNVQAAKRAHRIGQLHPVFVRNFALAGSLDDARQTVLSRKAKALLEIYGE